MDSLTKLGGIPVINMASSGDVVPAASSTSCTALAVPAYRRAMTLISEMLAKFPRSVRKDGARMETNHPLNRLLKLRPNDVQNSTQFWRTWFLHAAHAGNGYALIERDPATGTPRSLMNLMPECVTPVRVDFGDGSGWQQFYIHKPSQGKAVILQYMNVLHLASLSYDGMAGIDPTWLHGKTIERAITIERYQIKYLRKGTVLRGAVEIDGEATDDQLATLRANLKRYRGDEGEDDILILAGAKLNNTTISPQQSQLVEQSQATTKQIAQITGVSPEFLFEQSESKYKGSVESAGQDIVRYTLMPWISQAESELTLKLLTDAEQEAGLTVHLNPDEMLRGSSKEQMDVVAQGVNSRIYTPNEARAYLGQPESDDPDADTLKSLGDTAPVKRDGANSKADATPPASFSAFGPIIEANCAMIERKTEKAFENAKGKTGQEWTIWTNVFAEDQAKYVKAIMEPVAKSMHSLGLPLPEIDEIAQKYAAAIRKQAASGEKASLKSIAEKILK